MILDLVSPMRGSAYACECQKDALDLVESKNGKPKGEIVLIILSAFPQRLTQEKKSTSHSYNR